MTVTPTTPDPRTGVDWKVKVSGVVTGMALVITVIAHLFTVTPSGGGAPAAVVIPAASAPSVGLVPGAGYDGPASQPPTQGDPTGAPGYTASRPAVAKWDVVPRQVFTGDFNVGVYAYHTSGIDHVDFRVNGGEWYSVYAMLPNPQTANTQAVGVNTDVTGYGVYDDGIVEYYAPLHASDFVADAPADLESIAYPNDGEALVLPTIRLFPNEGGTYTRTPLYVATDGDDGNDGSSAHPKATIIGAAKTFDDCNHATIYLKAGDYHYAGLASGFPPPSNSSGWLTITAAPGVTYDQVRITDSDSDHTLPGCQLVRFKGVSVYNVVLYQTSGVVPHSLWLDGCFLSRASLSDDSQGFTMDGWDNEIFYTDGEVTHCRNAIAYANLLRNVYVHDIGEDALRGCKFVINTRVTDITQVAADSDGQNTHPDLFPAAGPDPVYDYLIYGVAAYENIGAQGIDVFGMSNSAIVSSHITTNTVGSWVTWWFRNAMVNTGVENCVIGPYVTVADEGSEGKPEAWYLPDSSFDNFIKNSTVDFKAGTTLPVPGWTVVP